MLGDFDIWKHNYTIHNNSPEAMEVTARPSSTRRPQAGTAPMTGLPFLYIRLSLTSTTGFSRLTWQSEANRSGSGQPGYFNTVALNGKYITSSSWILVNANRVHQSSPWLHNSVTKCLVTGMVGEERTLHSRRVTTHSVTTAATQLLSKLQSVAAPHLRTSRQLVVDWQSAEGGWEDRCATPDLSCQILTFILFPVVCVCVLCVCVWVCENVNGVAVSYYFHYYKLLGI